MTPSRDDSIPRPAGGVDIRRLPLTPMEGFVLSRVDGHTTASEIAVITGLSAADVTTVLSKLESLGAVQFGDGATPRAVSSAAPSPTSSAPAPSSPSPRTSPIPPAEPVIRVLDGPPPYDPSELDEPADLDPERKRDVLDTFYQLEKLDHYALLRVAESADKKAIKAAYYDVVGRYHPDKYFGKSLGTFKSKLERIFQRVTEAHDTLTRNASRAEYDQYLASQRETNEFEQASETALDDIRREIEREARYAPPADTGRPAASSSAPAPAPSAVPAGPSSPPRPALSADERRRAFARKLSGSTTAVRSAPPTRPSGGPGAREAAAESLKRQYESRLERARQERVQRYVKQAEEAVAAKNLVAAANALRIAVSLAPNDVPLADQLDKVERDAAEGMADKYLEQARYDERRGHMAEAAQAYEKVIRGRPNAYVYERAAHCWLEANGDPKKAFDLAKKAVELSPNETAYRITLARVYAKAGMEASALGELERARTIDPGDDTVKDWLKRLKRGEI